MGMAKQTLEQLIFLALSTRNKNVQNSKGEKSQAELDKAYAKDLSTAIDTYVQMHVINIPPGQAVATVGSPAAQTGATTSPLVTKLTML